MIWLGDISKIYRVPVENLSEKMANFEDFPPIFCLTANFLPGGEHSRLIFISGSLAYIFPKNDKSRSDFFNEKWQRM